MAKEITDNQPTMSSRDKMYERLRGRHQDLDFEDDEAIWGAMDSDYGDYEEKLTRQQEVDSGLAERFDKDPHFAGFFLDAVEGKDPVLALIDRYGEDFREILDDPAKQEELAEANKSYIERVSKEKELEKQYEQNIEQSLAIAEELEAEGYSPDEVNEAFEAVLEDAQQAILGAISREMLETKLKGLNYDEDMAEAEQTGEARAKNTKYTERVRDASELSGLPPVIDGRDAQGEAPESDPTLEALDRITNKDDVWQGAKRTPIN